jgi:hypothetical protein
VAMAAIVALTWYRYRARRHLNVIHHSRLKSKDNTGADVTEVMFDVENTTITNQADRQKVLLEALLALDQQHEAGKVSEKVYGERRRKIKAQLRTLMSVQETSRR